jgi:hypothetical protein
MSAKVTGPEKVYRVVCNECKQSEFRRDKGLAQMLADAHNAAQHPSVKAEETA